MPADCRYMRTRLQIEYSRLLDWCEVAGLVEYQDGQDFLASLKVDRLVLVAILTEIRASMQDLADLNGKYEELRPESDPASKKNAAQTEIVEEFSLIVLSYEKKAGERKYPRGINHVARGMAMGKNIVKTPRRLQWVAFDKDVFLKLLVRLTELNDHLHELMHGLQARELEMATQRTHLEMVQVRASVEELKHLVTAAMLLQEREPGESSSAVVRRRNEKALASLADFKSLNAANDVPPGQKPPAYDSIMTLTRLSYSQVSYNDQSIPVDSPNNRMRTEGQIRIGNHSRKDIWIEWKTYKTKYNHRLDKHEPLQANLKRVKELVALLQSDKPKEFWTPHCLGYFDDRDDSDQSEHDCRFGLVFEKPGHPSTPISLHDLIISSAKPSLTERVCLSQKVATCILYIHAVNWLHKALRSDSVIFFPHGNTTDIRQPFLTGYEYARPDKDEETSTGGGVNEWWELYVHPSYQGSDAKGTYRKTFDIYSLGIILLEIAYWKPIENILGLDPDAATADELKAIRTRLIRPGSEYLAPVKADLGDRYYTAVTSCLEGRGAFRIADDESEASAETGAKLQRGFTSLVVDGLGSISI